MCFISHEDFDAWYTIVPLFSLLDSCGARMRSLFRPFCFQISYFSTFLPAIDPSLPRAYSFQHRPSLIASYTPSEAPKRISTSVWCGRYHILSLSPDPKFWGNSLGAPQLDAAPYHFTATIPPSMLPMSCSFQLLMGTGHEIWCATRSGMLDV